MEFIWRYKQKFKRLWRFQ